MADETPFEFPESSCKIEGGFLTDYWHYDKGLPAVSGVRLLATYVQRGVSAMLVMPLSTVVTVSTIATSLFLLSGFLLILVNVDNFFSRVGSTRTVTAYFSEGASDSSIKRMLADLESNPNVDSVNFVSKTEALQLFRGDLGSQSGFLDGLDEDNPLPASVDVVVSNLGGGAKSLNSLVAYLKDSKDVSDVVYGSDWVEHMAGLTKVFRFFGYSTFFVVLAMVVFLIANTIKLAMYARREEIAIMKLVGGSDLFIKIPFVISGVIQGAIGSLSALVVLEIAFAFLGARMRSFEIVEFSLPGFLFLNTWSQAMIVLIGLSVGALGSFFALRKFVDI